jgi:hypothetical protein
MNSGLNLSFMTLKNIAHHHLHPPRASLIDVLIRNSSQSVTSLLSCIVKVMPKHGVLRATEVTDRSHSELQKYSYYYTVDFRCSFGITEEQKMTHTALNDSI